jgi:hypothetical protein
MLKVLLFLVLVGIPFVEYIFRDKKSNKENEIWTTVHNLPDGIYELTDVLKSSPYLVAHSATDMKVFMTTYYVHKKDWPKRSDGKYVARIIKQGGFVC